MAEIGMENKEKRRSDRCNGATRSRPEKEGRVVIMVLAHRKHGFEGGGAPEGKEVGGVIVN